RARQKWRDRFWPVPRIAGERRGDLARRHRAPRARRDRDLLPPDHLQDVADVARSLAVIILRRRDAGDVHITGQPSSIASAHRSSGSPPRSVSRWILCVMDSYPNETKPLASRRPSNPWARVATRSSRTAGGALTGASTSSSTTGSGLAGSTRCFDRAESR